MRIEIRNSYLEKLLTGEPVPGKPKYSSDVIVKFKKTILKLKNADSLQDLTSQQSLNFEALKGDLKGFHSVRVDRRYRLILRVEKDESISVSEILVVTDLTNHYQ